MESNWIVFVRKKTFFDRSYTGTKDSGLASPPSDAPRSSRRQIQLQMQRSTTCVGRSENLHRTLENLYSLYRGRLLRAGDAARLLDRIETLFPYLLGDRPNHYLEPEIWFLLCFSIFFCEIWLRFRCNRLLVDDIK